MSATAMDEQLDRDLRRTMEQLFGEHGPSGRDETDGIALDRELWRRLTELGFTRLTGDAVAGGSGAGWREAAALLGVAATHAVSMPLAEHDLLAGWLLEQAGLPMDDRLRTVAVLDRDGRSRSVPWASAVERVVTVRVDDGRTSVADVDASAISLTRGRNLLGEPRDDIQVSSRDGVELDQTTVEDLMLRGGLARAVQLTGALERILQLTIDHVGSRQQFGRPLSRFQVVQHQVADMAAEVSLARSCVEAAVHAGDTGSPRFGFLVAVARSCAGHAASVVVRNGHQLHGAIGTTREHDLHRSTLAALSWRSEFGSTRVWDARVADLARLAGPDGLWPLVTGTETA